MSRFFTRPFLMSLSWSRLPALLGTLCLLLAPALWAAEPPRLGSFEASPENELPIEAYAAEGERLFLWIPAETGVLDADRVVARRLQGQGIETWLVDVFAAHFLPLAESSMDRMSGEDLAALIAHAHASTGKRIYLLAPGRGAIPALRATRHWQLAHPQADYLAGALLLHPKFYMETPDPGAAADLMPIVHATNLPVFIIQPDQSPWRWRLKDTVPALESGGSEVFVQILRGVRDRFFFRPNADEHERATAERLPEMLSLGTRLLASVDSGPRMAAALPTPPPPVREGRRERALRPYQGDPTPPPLRLPDLAGEVQDLAGLRGQVVLVNFWASWCPPCVHEMPSMQRLADSLADQPFLVVGANMAEDRATIRRFLEERIKVDFPIWLDEDGAALQAWGVFAFPTSYLVDKHGRIRYALFGAVEWDDPQIVRIIERLIAESA